MKLKQLISSVQSLNYLSELKLNIKIAFRLSGLMKRAGERQEQFNKLKQKKYEEHKLTERDKKIKEQEDVYLKEYTKKKEELLKEFGTPQQGGNFNISPDKVDKFQEAFKPLNDEYKEPLESFKARQEEITEEYKKNADKFEAEIEELIEEEVEIKIPVITTADLEKTLREGIEPKHLIQLDWLITEAKEKK